MSWRRGHFWTFEKKWRWIGGDGNGVVKGMEAGEDGNFLDLVKAVHTWGGANRESGCVEWRNREGTGNPQ